MMHTSPVAAPMNDGMFMTGTGVLSAWNPSDGYRERRGQDMSGVNGDIATADIAVVYRTNQ